MSEATADPAAFETLRTRVFTDAALQRRLRPIIDPEAFIDAVVAAGRDERLHFTADDVRAAMKRGQTTWKMVSIPVL